MRTLHLCASGQIDAGSLEAPFRNTEAGAIPRGLDRPLAAEQTFTAAGLLREVTPP